MPLIMVLHSNIYDDDGNKYLRGESAEFPDDLVKRILERDEAEERPARIAVVQPPKRGPGRPKKDTTDA